MTFARIPVLAVAATLLFIAPNAVGQLLTDGLPVSFRQGLDVFDNDLLIYEAPALNMDEVQREDQRRESEGELPYDGRLVEMNLSHENAGEWFTLPNGDMVWKLRIASPGALSTELYFSDLYLPEGAELFFYSPDQTVVDGGYTSVFNTKSGAFASNLIFSDEVILEYYEPVEVQGKGRLVIEALGHRYRDLTTSARGSDACQVDINCPEGDDWQDQKRGVVRMRITGPDGTGWCSGVLVNNTALDCTPYILTAFHCISAVVNSQADQDQLRFWFNYERPECDEGNAPLTNIMMGGSIVARGHQNMSLGSDFALIELGNDVPEAYNAYYNGWNTQSTTIFGGGVGIHHPSSDVKKISTSTNNYITSSWGGGNNQGYWRVIWTGTESGHGVTEGGSSGSPLYDGNGLVVGTLAGGSSYCNEVQSGGQNQPDWYGKVSYHWDQNPGNATIHLKTKLDPLNTGQSVLVGTYAPCNQVSSVEETEADIAKQFKLFPNPTSGIFNVDMGDYHREVHEVIVRNLVGVIVARVPANENLLQLDLSGVASGLYIVTFEFVSGNSTSQRVARH